MSTYAMLKRFGIIAAAALAFATAGVVWAAGSASDEEGSGDMSAASPSIEEFKDFAAEERDQALQAGREFTNSIDRKLDEFEAWTTEKWTELSDEAREDRIEIIRDLRRQRNHVAEWYGAMKQSTSEAWDDVKDGFADAYTSLKESYQDAMNASEEG